MTSIALPDRLVRLAEPILVMELRKFRRRSGTALVGGAGLLLLVLPAALVALRDELFAQIALGILAALYALLIATVIPSSGGRSISRERETGSWDLLALTPLKSAEIADQKITAVALPVVLLIIAGVPAAMLAAYLAGVDFFWVPAIAVWLILAALAVGAWSVQSSCDCGRAAIYMAYLPAINAICSSLACAGYIVGIVLLFIQETRGHAGRMLLAWLCLQFVFGGLYFYWAFTPFLADPAFAPTIMSPAWTGLIMRIGMGALACISIALQAATLIAMRFILAWGIESGRRA